MMDGSGAVTVVKDGHEWFIKPWEGGCGGASATRRKTEEELEREYELMLRTTTASHFTKDRLLMCMDIAAEMRRLVARLNPERPPARAVRRDIQRKLKRLSQIQTALMWRPESDSRKFVQELDGLRSA